MITSLRRRFVAVLAVAAISATATQVLVPTAANAATTTLFNQTFKNNTANGDGAVVLPSSSGGTNMACLTASGNTTVVPTSCTSANDANGSGFLRLTDNANSKVGGLFAAASVPTAQGLDLTFNTYQYGTTSTPADGIAFALAAVDPTNPVSPPNIGFTGGSLGYAPYSTNKGLAYGYLGIGLDVFGNYSNSAYQGTGCGTSPSWISSTGQVKGQVVVKGPGNGTVGYCPIQSTATSTSSTALALRSTTRTASKVPVQVVINPNTSSVTSASGLTVAAKSYAVAFTPVGGAQRVLTSSLPTVGSGLNFPASYLDSSGLPKQLAFGFVASTGGSVDYHELDLTTVTTLNGSVPQLTVAQSAYTSANLAAGDPVTYVVKAGVEPGLSESGAISVTETMPTGVRAVSGSGSGWTCAAPVQNATTLKYSITCTNNSQPFAAGSTLPDLIINGTATAATTSTTIGGSSVVTASSADSNPGYGNTTVILTPTSVPSNLAITPSSGPSGTAVVITGTNTSAATAVQVGTTAELAAGTGTTLAQCVNNVAATGCFTINANGSIAISSMPTHATGAVTVKVVTLGSSGTVGFTYTSVPGTPTVTATAGVLTATATWDTPANGGSAITGYVLTPYKDGVAQTAVQIAAGTNTYTVANATAGSSYTFTVAAKNANGTGVTSTASNVAVPYTVPSAPTSPTATAGTSAARVSWTTPSSNGFSPITGYVITPYLGGVAQAAQTFNSTATTQTVTGLTAGSSYTFTVAAINAAGTGPASATSNAVTVNAGPTITSTPPDGEVGIAYSHQLTQSGGTAGYSYDLTSGALPDGLTLSSGGLISGTPTAAGSYTFRARVTDSFNEVSAKTFTVVIAAQPVLTFTGAQPDAQVGSAYSTTFTRTGGTGPFTFSTVSGTLPPGLTLNTATGVLSGTPTTAGDYAFTVKVVDSFGASDTKGASVAVRTIPGAPTIGTATGGTTSAVVRWTAPSVIGNSPITGYVVTPYLNGVAQTPVNVAAGATSQTLTGLTAGGTYTFTVAAKNAIGTGPASAASTAVTLNAAPTITSTPPNGEVGAAYSHQLTSAGGTSPLSYAVTAGTLPAGLSISSAGLIFGTPTTAGSSTFTVKVTDADGSTSSKEFTVDIATQPTLTYSSPLTTALVGEAYTKTLTRTGGTGPFTFSITTGTLPAGLTLNTTTGVLSGTPTTAGDYSFTAKVVDSFGQSDTKATTIAVRAVPGAPTVGTVTPGTTSAVVRWTAPTSDGNSALTGYIVTPYLNGVAQTPVDVPAGSTSRTLTGLTAGGTYTFTVAAKNAIGTGPASAASAAVTLNAAPAINSTPPNGEVGIAYSHQLTTAGGTGPLSYTITDGTLPAGLTITAGGLISGTPTTAGSSTFTVKVTDADGSTASKEITVVVAAPPTLTYTSPLTTALVGDAYSKMLTRSGGTGPFTYSITTGTLPAGLTLNTATGVLSGTPTAAGDYAFTVKVVDSFGLSDTKATTVAVRAVPSAPAIGAVTGGTTSAVVRWTAPTSDGNSPITGYVVIPFIDGVAQTPVNASAGSTSQVVTGLTPGATYTFTVAAKNAIGTGPASAASAPVTLNGAPTITSTPPNGEVGAEYSHQLTSAGGTNPLSYAVTAGSLPAGLTLSSGGLLFGTPTTAGSSTFTVRVTDADGSTSTKQFTVVVAAAPILTYSSPLPVAQVGDVYTRTLTRTGGTGPFTFSITTGTLPAGLTLNATTGVLSGTPTAAGDYAFTVKVVDSFGQSDTKVTTLAVRTVPSAPAPGNVTPGTSSAVVRWTAPTSDGNSAVTGYVVTPYLDGVAQTPVTFDSTATTQTVTGLTPGGVYTFTIAARNAAGTGPASAATAPVTLNAAPAITSTPSDGEVGVDYVHQFTASGGTGTLTWAVTSGSLPDGLTLSASGKLAGTPTTDGDFTFRVKVTDEDGATVNKQFTVTIAGAPNLTFPGTLPRVDVGEAYDVTLTHSGGTEPFTYSVSAGSLPPGLTLDTATGKLTGTPTTGGSYTFTIKIVDSLGQSDTKAASLVVRAPAAIALTVSDDAVRFGTAVTLSAEVDPSDATGTVTFRVTAPDGTIVELGPVTVVDGRARLTTTLGSFGANTVVARYNGDADHLPKTSADRTVEVSAYAGQAIITEFRTSGPAGGDDAYVEIYNAGPTMPLAGLVLESSSGTSITLPAGSPRLGQHRSYLFAGSDFSLGALSSPDVRRTTLGTGGFRLVAGDTADTVLDEVGPASGFHLGTGLRAIAGSPNDQWAYVRIETAGRPNDTRSNRADFALVSSTGGVVGGVQSMRGSASPTGLGDPWQRNGLTQSFLLDGTKAVDVSPNREYVVGAPGTLEIRRTITNTGTRTITEAKARTTAMSEANGLSRPGGDPARIARIRAVNPATATSQATVAGRGTVTVRNLSVDAPITAPAGGGLNSTFTIPLPEGGLAPGESVDVAFTFQVDVRGTFWFGFDVDARSTAGSAGLSKAQATKVVAKAEAKLVKKGAKLVKAASLTSGKL